MNTITLASIHDAERIKTLINQAYRGEQGWTKETDIVQGGRTSTDDVRALIQREDARLFVAKIHDVIAACICIEDKQEQAYIGTFAVNPAYQNQGLGQQMLDFAEQYVIEQLPANTLAMVVISQRTELIAYYQRRGYTRTGEQSDYPIHLNVGTPTVEGLTIECLKKRIPRQAV